MMPIDTTKMADLYYEQILYNEVIFHLEQEWGRKLDGHERHILIKGYKFGRKVEATCELKILSHK
jgi:hypothetical protein